MNNEQLEELFLEDSDMINGAELKRLLENHTYYMIFADLKAYPNSEFSTINTYEKFLKSKCEIVLLVIDYSCVTIYSKNKKNFEL